MYYNPFKAMDNKQLAGFRECDHTADGEIEVWAESLEELFAYSAKGMYALGGVELSPEPRSTQELQFSAVDDEALLVNFLGELIYLWEQHHLAFDCFEFELKDQNLKVKAEGAPIKTAARQIKAITYHRLKIECRGGSYYTHLVFDL